ncbi:hypothetical protein ACES2L_06025 [Bdellovibrio bacteriovorus]
MALYIALQRGHDGIVIREKGEQFQFNGKPGKWMKLVSDEKKAAPKKGKATDKAEGNDENSDLKDESEAEAKKGNKRKNDQEIE